jgi:hypothetical protein
VGFKNQGRWSFIGSESLTVPQDKPTINLEGFSEVDQIRRENVLHEFGHVLGMLHAEQDPQANCRAELNLKRFQAMGFTHETIESNFFSPEMRGKEAPNNGAFISNGIDNQSIMRMFTQPEFFERGEQSRCYGPPTDKLSEGDRSLVKMLYPLKPPDVSMDSKPRQLTIRFEGALAAEHFGFILSALYKKGKIELKKHIMLKGQTIEQAVAEEQLAPRGVTTDSLDNFLCSVNRHICLKKQATNIWTNTEATKNYVGQGQDCADSALPKFVLCVPNVRLESYIQRKGFNPSCG